MDIGIINSSCVFEIQEYAKGRVKDVKRGAETPRLAALMLEKYVCGFICALRCIEKNSDMIFSRNIQTLGDRLCVEIDPDFIENRKLRWDAKPADLIFNQ